MSRLDTLHDGLRRSTAALAGLAINALLPPRCLACGCVVERPGALCSDCWEGVDFIAPPLCAACGYPFAFEMEAEALCPDCIREQPAYDRARAVMTYNDASKRLLLGFKHGDRTDGAPAYATWLARAGAPLIAEADLILPVPLHWLRLFRRRYNQSALLAQALARHSGLPVATGLLRRRRNTPPQGHLPRSARRQNVAGAFAVAPDARAQLEGRRLLLIDDVLTTGATAEACAKLLKRQGAAAVDVLVLARVLRS